MASRHVREDGSQMSWAESQRHSNAQAAAKVAVGQNQFPGRIDLGAGSGGMVAKRDPGFRECRAAGGARKKLHAKFRLEPG